MTGGAWGVYRFLCALQHQDAAAGLVAWGWGPLEAAPFLPRVLSGKLVLCRAQWNVTEAELRALGQTRDADQFAAVQAWRAERRLPRYVALADLDNELVIDLDNVPSVAALAHQFRGRRQAVLVEMFPGPRHCAPPARKARHVSSGADRRERRDHQLAARPACRVGASRFEL
jgi:hypothetical protein